MNASLTVRRLRAQDADRWRELWDGYLSFYRAEVPEEVTAQTFKRLCDGDQAMVGLVAVDGDDRPLGLAHLIYHPATWTSSDYCYLEDLFVDRSLRGTGISQALFEAVYAHARESGSSRVYWHTQQFNGAARSLYDTVGSLTSFVVYERDLD